MRSRRAGASCLGGAPRSGARGEDCVADGLVARVLSGRAALAVQTPRRSAALEEQRRRRGVELEGCEVERVLHFVVGFVDRRQPGRRVQQRLEHVDVAAAGRARHRRRPEEALQRRVGAARQQRAHDVGAARVSGVDEGRVRGLVARVELGGVCVEGGVDLCRRRRLGRGGRGLRRRLFQKFGVVAEGARDVAELPEPARQEAEVRHAKVGAVFAFVRPEERRQGPGVLAEPDVVRQRVADHQELGRLHAPLLGDFVHGRAVRLGRDARVARHGRVKSGLRPHLGVKKVDGLLRVARHDRRRDAVAAQPAHEVHGAWHQRHRRSTLGLQAVDDAVGFQSLLGVHRLELLQDVLVVGDADALVHLREVQSRFDQRPIEVKHDAPDLGPHPPRKRQRHRRDDPHAVRAATRDARRAGGVSQWS
mmetsp:Transcript_26334/g.88516  ORF Transcript_26334/g.88516 Transcript_26334/m.88516 type:complete len:421 (-) Transcript_26334:8-1270(-)